MCSGIMNYPLVTVQTKDGLWFYGFYTEAPGSKTVLLNIHGTGSNFYEEYFLEVMTKRFLAEGVSLLFTNNRGTGVYDAYQKTGCAVEKFEECVIDIDTWIAFALERGYENIILSGHSLGTEKIVYYMSEGMYRDKVKGMVLLAPADSVGYHIYSDDYKPSVEDKKRFDALLAEAQDLIVQGRGDEFLGRYVYGGISPKSAESFVNFSYLNPEFGKALPFHTRKLEAYSKISIPILALIGDQAEYTAIPPEEALELMKQENPRTEIHQFRACNHDFEGKEDELTELVVQFIKGIL